MNFIVKTTMSRCPNKARDVYLYSNFVTFCMQASVTTISGDKYESVTRN
jgi:hypothetical protein